MQRNFERIGAALAGKVERRIGIDAPVGDAAWELLRSILDFATVQLRLAAVSVAAATRELLQQYVEGALPGTDPSDIVDASVRLATLVVDHWTPIAAPGSSGGEAAGR